MFSFDLPLFLFFPDEVAGQLVFPGCCLCRLQEFPIALFPIALFPLLTPWLRLRRGRRLQVFVSPQLRFSCRFSRPESLPQLHLPRSAPLQEHADSTGPFLPRGQLGNIHTGDLELSTNCFPIRRGANLILNAWGLISSCSPSTAASAVDQAVSVPISPHRVLPATSRIWLSGGGGAIDA